MNAGGGQTQVESLPFSEGSGKKIFNNICLDRDACYFAKAVGGNYPDDYSWIIINNEDEIAVASESGLDSSPTFCLKSCDTGSGYDIDTESCAVCQEGYVSSSGNCYLCPKSTYADAIGSVTCTACPENTSSQPGSTDITQCLPASCFDVKLMSDAGYAWFGGGELNIYKVNAGEGEVIVKSFTFSASDDYCILYGACYDFEKVYNICLEKEDACYYAKMVGGEYPNDCSWEITNDDSEAVASESYLDSSPPFCLAVEECDAGSGYDTSLGACSPCPKGSYEVVNFCYVCTSNTYSDAIGSVSCTNCPTNTISESGSTDSNQCVLTSSFNVKLMSTSGFGWYGVTEWDGNVIEDGELQLYKVFPGGGEDLAESFTFIVDCDDDYSGCTVYEKEYTICLEKGYCYYAKAFGGFLQSQYS